jgi:hypothetical protein
MFLFSRTRDGFTTTAPTAPVCDPKAGPPYKVRGKRVRLRSPVLALRVM